MNSSVNKTFYICSTESLEVEENLQESCQVR